MLEGTAVLWEEFQSTLPVRGATHFVCDSHVAVQDFNPRSP